MEIGKTYLVKKDIFSFKAGELWTLKDKGYQFYYGEHNFVFADKEKHNKFLVLRDVDDEDMKIYYHLEEYFAKIT